MQKLILSLTFLLILTVGKSQLTEQEKKDLYPETYTFEHAEKFMNEAAYDKAMWIYINLYPNNQEKVVEKVKIIKEKNDTLDLRMFIVNSFSMYALFDPTVVNWESGAPSINSEMMNLKGSWGDAIIKEFYPTDPKNSTLLLLMTKKGYMVVFNYEKAKFTIRVEGEKVEPTEQRLIFVADNRALQLNDVEFYKFPKLSESKNIKDSLDTYMYNEIEYYNGMLNANLKEVDHEVLKIGNKKFLFWSYALPENLNAELDKQYFLTTLIGDRYFSIATAENHSVKAKEIKKYMSTYASTLKIYGKEMDIKQIQETLRNE